MERAEQNRYIAALAPDDCTLVPSRDALITKGAAEPNLSGAFPEFRLSEAGRSALRSANLIVRTDDAAPASLRLPETPDAGLRPIVLTPSLLVGLDQQKRREFVALWRSTFPRDTGPVAAE